MIRTTLLAAALAASFGAQAATSVYNFSGTMESGSLIGTAITGQLSFDDSTLSAATDFLPLLSLSFSFGGGSYTLATADAGSTNVAFNAGTLIGVNAVYSGGVREVSLTDGFGSPYLAYTQGTDVGSATLSFVAAAAVPEPTTWALALAGLGLVALRARRQRAA